MAGPWRASEDAHRSLKPLTLSPAFQLAHCAAQRSVMETIMGRRIREWRLAELIDNPALALALATQGLDRRSVALLLETAEGERQREVSRPEEPIPE